ncbi:hypothetical protein F4823DRAFT_633913 [Ustulina deusta]|nr:hypothetical protein F4823DRAFT_633913 [Ustulina deusta]
MLHSSLFLLPAFELLAQATESYSPLSTPSGRRQLVTCDQTYGNGSIPCGGPESTWCFNPNLGQTCCEREGAFCNDGSYCAPVAGYCCFDDEDLVTCAARAGFDLPNSAVNDYITNPDHTVATPTRVSRTFIVTPFLTADPGSTPIYMPDSDAQPSTEPRMDFVTKFTVNFSAACHKTSSSSAPGIAQITNVSASSSKRPSMSASPSTQPSASGSPLVQVSIAAKGNDGRIGAIFVMVVAGVFAILV